MFGKLTKEYEVFKSVPHNMQVLLGTNMLYALVSADCRNLCGCLYYEEY